MNAGRLTLATDIAAALRSRMGKGQGLTVPYARKWELGGCGPIHSLWSYPYDGLLVLGTGLLNLGHPLADAPNGLIVDMGPKLLWVAADRSVRGEGPPDAYLVGTGEDDTARYVGNAAEVVIEFIRGMSQPAPALLAADELQVGFPGRRSTTTYVGSWQWGVHGEAIDDESVRRAATATLGAVVRRRSGIPDTWRTE